MLSQNTEGVADVLKTDISDTLLYELLIGLVLLQRDKSHILTNFDWNKCFIPLLNALDVLNRMLCDGEIQDSDDMGWPGVICRGQQKPSGVNTHDDVTLIRKSDVENQILDEGKWIIVNGSVYDVKNYAAENQETVELLQNGIGNDLSAELSAPEHRPTLEYITQHLRIGKLLVDDKAMKINCQQLISLTHFKSERTLSYLLGLRANFFQKGTELQPAEIQCKTVLNSPILSGGLQLLQPSNPFDEEKGEARSSGSTPTENSNHQISDAPQVMSNWSSVLMTQRTETLLYGLGEGRLTEQLVQVWHRLSERYCKEHHLIWHQEFQCDHPVMELERLLTAVLIRHQSLGQLVLAVIDKELSGQKHGKLPPPVADIIRR